MRYKGVATLIVAALLIGTLGYAGWTFVQSRQRTICSACNRPIHGSSKAVALVDGRRMSYCCPACALSEHKQSGRTVQIVSLTDFNTGRDLDPNAAFLVRGSDVSSCAHLGSTVVMDKQPAEPLYDRCAPSLLAFSTQSAAAEFSRIHGGRVLPFADVRGQYR